MPKMLNAKGTNGYEPNQTVTDSNSMSAAAGICGLNCLSVHADTQHAKSSNVRPASLFFHFCLVKKLSQMSVTIDYTCLYI